MARNEAPFIGSHLSLSSPEYYLGTAKKAIELGENAFMFYTGAPQNTLRLPTAKLRIEEGREHLRANGILESKIIVHAPYIINLGNYANEGIYGLAKRFLGEELLRVNDFHLSYLVLHPGSSVGLDKDLSMKAIAEGLNEVLEQDHSSVTILLETMAGKGSERGSTFEELKEIYSLINCKDRVGFCLDTCHINDAGYDERDIASILDAFDKELGLSNLKAIHLNDSKNVMGSHKDRHENIGYGTLGFSILEQWVKEPRLVNIPKILETPMAEEKYPYKKEIEMLRSGLYTQHWREEL